jgi:hypothetical protein
MRINPLYQKHSISDNVGEISASSHRLFLFALLIFQRPIPYHSFPARQRIISRISRIGHCFRCREYAPWSNGNYLCIHNNQKHQPKSALSAGNKSVSAYRGIGVSTFFIRADSCDSRAFSGRCMGSRFKRDSICLDSYNSTISSEDVYSHFNKMDHWRPWSVVE